MRQKAPASDIVRTTKCFTVGTNRYPTPKVFIQAVKQFLGIEYFDFDYAADTDNTQSENWWGEQTDALAQPVDRWRQQIDELSAGWGWLNPPFANIAPWAARCAEADRQIALLVPASVGSNWFRDYVDKKALVLFLNGRLAFIENKPDELYPKDCILCLYGTEPGYAVWDWRA